MVPENYARLAVANGVTAAVCDPPEIANVLGMEGVDYMIENGKKGRPVKTFTIAGNFFELLKNIDAVADTVKIGMGGFTAFGAPSVLVKNISVAG